MSKLFVKSLIFPHSSLCHNLNPHRRQRCIAIFSYFIAIFSYFIAIFPISLPYFLFHCHIFIFHCHIFIFHVSKYSPLCHNSTPRRRQRCIAIERARPAQPLPLFGSGRWGFQDLNLSVFNILKWSLRFSRLKL